MHAFLSALRRIPYWAYLLVFMVIQVNSVYLYYKGKYPDDGLFLKSENGQWIADNFRPVSTAYIAGIRSGDIILSIDNYPVEIWFNSNLGLKAGDTAIYKINRNGRLIEIPVAMGSYFSGAYGFFWLIFIIQTLFSIASLYILIRKPHQKPVWLFFIYLQLFAVNTNAWSLPFPDMLAIFACNLFLLTGCFLGPVLIHFHLVFPKPVKLITPFKRFPLIFYIAGVIVFIPYSVIQYFWATSNQEIGSLYSNMDRIGLIWISLAFILALATAIYQFMSSKDTLSRNQLRMVIIGSFFGFITPIIFALFYNYINQLNNYAIIIMIPHGIGSLIMICCILIAIFRYRIWDIEVIIRKALLYLSATAVIIISCLFLIWFVDRFISRETNLTRFVILAVSVIFFLVLRDRIQRLIDRLFHRETYDSATVVSDFEAKLAGIYRLDELKQKIVQSIDEIFHFKSFVFNLKKNGLIFEPAYVYGTNITVSGSEYEINRELEERLQKAKVFSPEELNKKPPILEETTGELVVPLVSDGQSNGFFICGQKKSERIYSRQDIQVLSLLAQRVVSLLHTAGLYQKDLDRQLMLERERTRISQDMHDDVGASLTRISILSELAKNRAETDRETKQWLEQITTTSRNVMEEMSQIIWALNPKNDTLEGLIAYIRRFANEYLEPTSIHCAFELPEIMPKLPLSVEVRRNIYLVVREVLHNVVKHSGATKVIISLQPHPPAPRPVRQAGSPPVEGERYAAFILTIRDNGKGFDLANVEFPGNGLNNMKKRMADIGGEFFIITSPGEGTEIKLFVSPLQD
jgi:signal transduction histidine kinase